VVLFCTATGKTLLVVNVEGDAVVHELRFSSLVGAVIWNFLVVGGVFSLCGVVVSYVLFLLF